MKRNFFAPLFTASAKSLALILLLANGSETIATGEESVAVTEPSTNMIVIDVQPVLAELERLRGEQQSALYRIEQIRQQTDLVLQDNLIILTNQLSRFKRDLDGQREIELEALQSRNQSMLIIGGLVMGIALVGILTTGFFQMKAVRQIVTVTTQHHRRLPPQSDDLWEAELQKEMKPREVTTRSLLSSISNLEQKLTEMESGQGISAALEDTSKEKPAPKPKELRSSPAKLSKTREAPGARPQISNPKPKTQKEAVKKLRRAVARSGHSLID